jgi:putative endopeptidase
LIESFPFIKYIFKGLELASPSIKWGSYKYAVDKTATFHLINKCLSDLTMNEWKAWLSIFTINNYYPYISPQTALVYHNLFGKTMTGLPASKKGDDLWLEVLKTKASIPLNEFTREFCLSPKRRKEVIGFFKKIQNSTIDILNQTEWLDPPTREKAINKVESLKVDISYPKGSYQFPLARIADELCNHSLIENILILDKADFEYNIVGVRAKRHTPWDNPVFVVNAHYWDYENRIFFPGPILEAPNFLLSGQTRKKTRANHNLGWNYGNLGATIGHEITHAFDVEGMRVDDIGLKHEWATNDDKNQYAKKVKDLQNIFKSIKQDGLQLDASYIISEAIADLGGLSISLYALKKEMNTFGWSIKRKQEEIRWFFISYAYSWQQKMRPMARIRRVYVDEHPPAWTRVNYIVNQFSDWYESFGINNGKLYLAPEDRVQFFSG